MSGKENSLLYHGKPICFGEGVIIEGTTDSFDPDVEALGGFWLLDPFGVGGVHPGSVRLERGPKFFEGFCSNLGADRSWVGGC